MVNLITTGIVGAEIMWLNNLYVLDAEFELDSLLIWATWKPRVYCVAWCYPSRSTLQLRSPCVFFLPFFFCWCSCHPAHFVRLCNSLVGWPQHFSPFLWLWISVLKKGEHVLCTSTCLLAPDISRTDNLCEWAVNVNRWRSWLRAYISPGTWLHFVFGSLGNAKVLADLLSHCPCFPAKSLCGF